MIPPHLLTALAGQVPPRAGIADVSVGSSPHSLFLLVSFGVRGFGFFHPVSSTGQASTKPYFPFGLVWWRHELADGFKDRHNLLIMTLYAVFQLLQFDSQFFMGRQHLPKSYESSHDRNVDLDGPSAVENRGQPQ